MFKVSKKSLERRSKVRHRFIEVREVTELSTGSYEELTTFADRKKVMFMVKKVNKKHGICFRLISINLNSLKLFINRKETGSPLN